MDNSQAHLATVIDPEHPLQDEIEAWKKGVEEPLERISTKFARLAFCAAHRRDP